MTDTRVSRLTIYKSGYNNEHRFSLSTPSDDLPRSGAAKPIKQEAMDALNVTPNDAATIPPNTTLCRVTTENYELTEIHAPGTENTFEQTLYQQLRDGVAADTAVTAATPDTYIKNGQLISGTEVLVEDGDTVTLTDQDTAFTDTTTATASLPTRQYPDDSKTVTLQYTNNANTITTTVTLAVEIFAEYIKTDRITRNN